MARDIFREQWRRLEARGEKSAVPGKEVDMGESGVKMNVATIGYRFASGVILI